MKIVNNTLLFRILLFITLVSIEYLATTTIHIEVMESMWDKANHFIAFFTLYILLCFAYKNLSILWVSLILLGFGLQIEIVQSFIDGRFFSIMDVVADGIGIFIGIIFLKLFKVYFKTN